MIVCSIIVCTQVLLIVCSIVVMYWHGALLPQTGLQLNHFGQFPEEFLLEVTAYLAPNARSYFYLSRSFAFFGTRLANLYVDGPCNSSVWGDTWPTIILFTWSHWLLTNALALHWVAMRCEANGNCNRRLDAFSFAGRHVDCGCLPFLAGSRHHVHHIDEIWLRLLRNA